MQLQTVKKGLMTMSVYFAKMKRLVDTLAIAGKPIENANLVTYILTRLESQEYKSLIPSLLARGESMNLDDLYALLLSHRMRLDQKKGKLSYDVMHNLTANFAQKSQDFTKPGFGNQKNNQNLDSFFRDVSNSAQNNNNGGNFDPIICQIYFIPGHGANKCKNRFDRKFVPWRQFGRGGKRGFRLPNGYGKRFAHRSFSGVVRRFNGQYNPRGYGYQGCIVYPNFNHISTPSYYYPDASSSTIGPAAFNRYNSAFDNATKLFTPASPTFFSLEAVKDFSWYYDNRASTHVANKPSILLQLKPYIDTEQLLVGDGNGLKITYTGYAKLATLTHSPILLHNILIPHITKNQLSVSKSLTDNDVFVEFLANFYYI